MSHEPKRLIVSEANELGLGLASARRQLPNANDLARLAKRLTEAGIALPEHAFHLEPQGAPSPAANVSSFGLRAKLGIGLGAVAALGLGTWVGSRAEHPEQRPIAQLTASPVPRATDAVTPANAPSPAPERRSSPGARVAPPSRAPAAPSALSEPPASSPAPAAPVESRAPAASLAPAPAAPARRSAPQSASANGNSVYVAPTARETPTSEIELVKQARNAVNSDPARAYALTERCRAEFPRAEYGQERDYIAITALARLGRENQARALASSFRARYPRSVYISQLERLLGTE